jgi:nucleotide-binding universal stress UspA family protein
MLAIRTILHPTDFSDRSTHAFHLACALARDYGARLVLLHVNQPPVAVYGEMGALPTEPVENQEALRKKLYQLKPTDPKIQVAYYFGDGNPAAEIVRTAEEVSCELIVMGTHGRTGLGRILMGSVAEQVLRKASCPVLTVKAPSTMTAAPASEPEEAVHA